MIPVESGFFSETKSFIKKNLCALRLGLTVVGYALRNLGGRAVSWIKECLGTTKKTDVVGRETILSKVQVLEAELTQLKNENAEATASAFASKAVDEREIQTLKEQNAQLKNENAEATAKASASKADYEGEIQSLEEQNDQLDEQNAQLDNENKRLQDELNKVNQDLIQLKAQCVGDELKINQRIAELERTVNDITSEKEIAERELDYSKKAEEMWKKRVAEQSEALEGKQNRIRSLESNQKNSKS